MPKIKAFPQLCASLMGRYNPAWEDDNYMDQVRYHVGEIDKLFATLEQRIGIREDKAKQKRREKLANHRYQNYSKALDARKKALALEKREAEISAEIYKTMPHPGGRAGQVSDEERASVKALLEEQDANIHEQFRLRKIERKAERLFNNRISSTSV